MHRQLTSLLVLTLTVFSCTDRPNRNTQQLILDTAQAVADPPVNSEEECIFDTSTYKFTTEALLKYSRNIKYKWDTATKSATTYLENGDRLTLHIGGCTHFGFQATLLTSTAFTDTVELLNKTKWLAKTFFYHGFEKKIPTLISKGHISGELADDGQSRGYTFNDPDTTETNLILDGFRFEKKGDKTFIDLLSYIN